MAYLRSVPLLAAAVTALVVGCTPVGAVSDNNPSTTSAQFVGAGRVAVDPRSETIYVVGGVDGGVASPWVPAAPSTPPCDADFFDAGADDVPVSPAQLVAIDPDTRERRVVTSFDGFAEAQVVFPPSGVLLALDDSGLGSELRLFDRQTHDVLLRQSMPPSTISTPMLSPDGRFLAMASMDGLGETQLQVIDTSTLATLGSVSECEFNSVTLGAYGVSWLNATDDLVVVWSQVATWGSNASAHVGVWSLETLRASGFGSDPGGFWTGARESFDVTGIAVSDASWMGRPGFFGNPPSAPMAVSPNDRFVAVAVSGGIALIDLSTQASMTISDVVAPAAFTPDSSTLVLEVHHMGMPPALDFVDVATGTQTSVDVPVSEEFAYFTTREGHDVIVSGVFDQTGNNRTQRLVVVDRTTHAVATPLSDTSAPNLDMFVSRIGHDEVWMLNGDFVDRLDLDTGSVTPFSLGFVASGLGILPMHDRLVFDTMIFGGQTSGTVTLWDPVAHAATATVTY